jgi:hypothetical protein
VKITASGFAWKKIKGLGQESEQKSILAIYTTQLPTLLTKVLDGKSQVVQCFARGTGTKRVQLVNHFHIGARLSSRHQSTFCLNLKEKQHKVFSPIDQKKVLSLLQENEIIEPQVEEIVLKFQCPELVEEINEVCNAGLPPVKAFRFKSVLFHDYFFQRII